MSCWEAVGNEGILIKKKDRMEINGVLIQLFVVSNISALEQFFLFFLFKRGRSRYQSKSFSSFIVPFYSFLFIRISYNF